MDSLCPHGQQPLCSYYRMLGPAAGASLDMILAFTAQSRGQGASTEQSQVTMGSAMMVGMQAGAQNGFLEGGELRGPRRVL